MQDVLPDLVLSRKPTKEGCQSVIKDSALFIWKFVCSVFLNQKMYILRQLVLVPTYCIWGISFHF